MFEKMNSVVQSIIDDGIPGNDILILKDGKEIYRSYRGYSDRENRTPMNGKEIYNMYSCSKPITATATMQFIEKGIISLDTPLYEVIPEFKKMYVLQGDEIVKAKNHITIKHLLTMTAGFSYNLNSKGIEEAKKATNGECPTVETIKYLSQEPLFFEPGSMWRYSLCHDVLAAVIEVLSGMSYHEYIEKNIFKPLGMTNSTFLLPDSQVESVCAQYIKTTNGIERCGKEIQSYKLGSKYESGGAGLVSTVEDYIKFLEAIRIGDIILKKQSIDLMQTDALDEVDIRNYWCAPDGYGYGLGVRCAKTQNDAGISDFGWGGAAGSYLAVDRKNNISLFFGMHVLGLGNLAGRKAFIKFLNK